MAYSLSTHYAGQGLLDSFHFFTGAEPNNGFVDYKSKEDAIASNLVSVDEFNRVKLGVDSITTYSTSDKGRPSVRLTSNDAFNYGLVIADFAHMPGSTCGTWPAFWAFNDVDNGKPWYTGGEIDIIEGANTAERNLYSAHTTTGCHAPGANFGGVQGTTDCSFRPGNIGCNYVAPPSDIATYGDAFNAVGGGVYAMEWDAEDIKIWHFARASIPEDIKTAPMTTPDPSTWGPPQARFGGSSCDAKSHFWNMSLVINTNFCGAYAGDIWGMADSCNELAPTCEEFVASSPSSFANAFWEINYIDIYKKPVHATNTLVAPFGNGTLPSNATANNATLFPHLRNNTLSFPPVPAATRPAFFHNGTVIANRTRTVTVHAVPTDAPAGTGARIADPALATGMPHAISEPFRAGGMFANPSAINGWALLGCFGSHSSFKSFSPIATAPTMDTKSCVDACGGRKFAGVYADTCYCADTLRDAAAVAHEKCNTPCAGNPDQICGGKTSPAHVALAPTNSTRFHNTTGFHNIHNVTLASLPRPNLRVNTLLPRDAPSDILLTVYGNFADNIVPPPGAPGKGGNPFHEITVDHPKGGMEDGSMHSQGGHGNFNGKGEGSSMSGGHAEGKNEGPWTTMTPYHGATGTVDPTGTYGGYGYEHESPAVTTTVTVTYTTICASDPATLDVLEYRTTMTLEQPCESYTPTITTAEVPMATCTETCDACGAHGESTVTLTVPAAVVAGIAGDHVLTITAVPVPLSTPTGAGDYSNGGYGHSGAAGDYPVAGTAAATTMGLLQTLGLGVALWFAVFWVGIVL
ncbi:hypothetical protein F4808DRAFT_476169 [Astrocystis sublimbata]|nr:hypothetical protein F4808DRAFT_476169 [Astrocystis sublimbata]